MLQANTFAIFDHVVAPVLLVQQAEFRSYIGETLQVVPILYTVLIVPICKHAEPINISRTFLNFFAGSDNTLVKESMKILNVRFLESKNRLNTQIFVLNCKDFM